MNNTHPGTLNGFCVYLHHSMCFCMEYALTENDSFSLLNLAWKQLLHATRCNWQTWKIACSLGDLRRQTSSHSNPTCVFCLSFWFCSNQLKKSAVRKWTVQKSSYFYSCNLVREYQITLKREILCGKSRFFKKFYRTLVIFIVN